ncbi:hypothetical protein HMPREF0542_10663 [Ligilactobacillus ruminis ATCC 25644]|uniref:Uncharacterized protein n=1 Tax=Ligilactobacillus ruminis ATCC 25644 TaxID=525362 RepID=E7FP36_9LACO|nr:hypothetical protein HMPREF0542_10663 [Ligilactobacillus ruminis ATCC 25644]
MKNLFFCFVFSRKWWYYFSCIQRYFCIFVLLYPYGSTKMFDRIDHI